MVPALGSLPCAASRARVSTTRIGRGQATNVVLIVADDLGYADVGVYGCHDVPTPNIDSIARNGVRFTNGYVTCPVCSPTRAGLMTGRYQQRFGHEFNPGPPAAAAKNFGLPLTETTLADRMKALGRTTGMFGKWHLGYEPEFHPTKRGFDEFYGFLAGSHSYFLTGGRPIDDPLVRGTEPVKEITYLTDNLAQEAGAFLERHREEPFFLYLPFNAVHAPMEATPERLAKFSHIKTEPRRTFAAMLSAMDDAVGHVLERLRALELEDDTLVVFLSDNGGPTQQTSSRNNPLRGVKGEVYEGGIRVPFMMQWKGQLPSGNAFDRPVSALDILPTAIAAAGGKVAADWKLDGVNLLPYLRGEKSRPPHDALYWRYGEPWAIRMGDWKLRCELRDGKPQLYDLAADLGETSDLAEKHPDKVAELHAAWKAWNAQLEPPRWIKQDAPRPSTPR
ncbi:MAG: sulfatase [Candidatus Hydrogenedentes bacterium]|nr:sulfatase [Candidatus Hydrogenedentota bacterium]